MSNNIYFINGEFLPESETKISVNDLGLLRGYGIFDFFKAVNSKVIFLEDHLARLNFSCRQMGFEIPYNNEQLKTIIYKLIEQNSKPLLGIKIIVTGGYSLDGYSPTKPNVIMIAKAFNYIDKPKGMHLMTLEYIRENPTIKTLNYIVPIQHLPKMKAIGADDFLYHKNGIVSELSRSNVFIIKNNTIITPKEGVLLGVTRKNTIMLAQKKWAFEERDITLKEVLEANEVFTTGSTKKICAITKIDQTIINEGKIGEITLQLMANFEALEQSYLQ